MKKIFINELETEERNKLIKNNKKLIEILQSDLYECNMFMQEEDGTTDGVIRKDIAFTECYI